MDSKYDIFISYSRKNAIKVLSIKKEIEKLAGVKCWIDYKIQSGSYFEKEIIKFINICPTFLFMLSKESQNSEYALSELKLAKRKGKRIIPVYIESCEMSDEVFLSAGSIDNIFWDNVHQRNKLIVNIRNWSNKSIDEFPVLKLPTDFLIDVEEIKEALIKIKGLETIKIIFNNTSDLLSE